jgi:hypothetical protein
VSRTVATTVLKMATYRVAGVLRREQQLIDRRWTRATSSEAEAFARALERVRSYLAV